MTVRKLLLSMSLLVLFTSCESEFDKQLRQAKALIEQEAAIHASQNDNGLGTTSSVELLNEIQIEINKIAHISGNERLFHIKLSAYKNQYLDNKTNTSILITKFP